MADIKVMSSLLSWRWKQQLHLKRWYLSTRLYGVTFQNTATLCDNVAIKVKISSQIQNFYKILKDFFEEDRALGKG